MDKFKMIITSYAQNFEDIILWRSLKDLNNIFYIDVGASDPELYSVTKAFYDLGATGINIEPLPNIFELLKSQRPNDINLNCALDKVDGKAEFFSINNGNGLSTLSSNLSEQYFKNGWNVDVFKTSVTTLKSICEKFVKNDIHFLKIDVEGAEKNVLEGADFNKFRPWIILIEATLPQTQILCHEEWEYILISNNYKFAYFDGLNRFYISKEKYDELIINFTLPPNIFDKYTLPVYNKIKMLDNFNSHLNLTINQLNLEIQKNKTDLAILSDAN